MSVSAFKENTGIVELSILIPCLNEESTIPFCINQAIQVMQNTNISYEIIVCDNNSSDNTAQVAKEAGALVVTEPNVGYGNSLKKCIQSAKGRYCVMADADCSYDFKYIPDFVASLKLGNDFVVGNRYKGGIQKSAMPALHKYVGTPIISLLGRLMYHNNVCDYNCGMRAFTTEKIKRLNLSSTGMEFATEMIIKSSMAGYKIAQIPVSLGVSMRKSSSHLRTWTDGFRHLSLLIESRKKE